MRLNKANHPKYTNALLGCALLTFATALSVLSLQAGSSHASRGSGGAVARIAATTVKRTWAGTAGAEALNEPMHMRITSVKGKLVSARGSAGGTIAGSVSFNLVLSSASRASAEFQGSNSHGTISGKGTASYRVAGPISYFDGTVTSIGGSGRYAHAYSQGIQFSGTVNRKTYEVTMLLHGKWHA